jgi:hypothetical protein
MERIGRRVFLKTGLAIPALVRPLASLQEVPRRAKGVIWLWMGGGMSPWESWDPKPHSPFKAIDTSVPGIQVSEQLPTCALQMKHLSILRTVSHRQVHVDHATHLLHTGVASGSKEVPTIGTIVSRELAAPGFPLPSHMVIDPPSLPPSTVFGEDHAPFRLNSRLNPIPNLRRNVAAERDRQRAALVLEQNAEWAALRQQQPVKQQETGFAVSEKIMNTPLLRTFNWEEEPEGLRKEYGGAFGENCLLARRLIQAGCAFVEIGLGGLSLKCDFATALKTCLAELDRGLGTLVKDLAEKGLLGQVVVVCATEYGRSPESDGFMWRDVWPRGFSVVLAGGTLAGGRVHGSTGADGRSCDPPVSVPDLLATVYRACGIDPEKEYPLEEGRTWKAAQGGKPVAELF